MVKSQTPQTSVKEAQFNFLGAASVQLENQIVRFRTRKTLALLVYLLLEPGFHARDKIASLLWAEADQSSSRALLRSTLGYLNRALGQGWLVARRESIGLDATRVFSCDLIDLERAFQDTAKTELELQSLVNRIRGEFLEGFLLPDAPEFDDWVMVRRELTRQWFDVILERLSILQAEVGKPQQALETALKRLHLEPLNEAAHRKVIELHLQMGSRVKALEAYQNCQEILAQELGLIPEPQTQALIEHLQQTVLPVIPRVLTLVSTNNSVLVGRNDAWQRIETAWQAGQHIFMAGEAGAGKSRLMLEFAASKGDFAQQFGRPGDSSVPFSSITRGIRHALSLHPNLELAVWVRRELSRLLPELEPEILLPISTSEDRLRLFDAVSQFFLALRQLGLFLLGDDIQFFDDSSIELIAYMIASSPVLSHVSSLVAFRHLEVSTRFKELVTQMVETERAILIQLEPLNADHVSQMLTNLMPNTPRPEELSVVLHQFTGGNPLFVLETVRALSERGGFEQLTAERFENRRRVTGLPRTPKVQTIISRRFERLSSSAQDLARLAAIMGEEFTLERASKILQIKQLELLKSHEELEVAQVLRGSRFSHDLIFETVLEGIPEAARIVLHGLVLDVLEDSATPEGVLVQHAWAASRWASAFHHSIAAAKRASSVFAYSDALEHATRARQLFLIPPSGFDPRNQLTDIRHLYDELINAYFSLNELDAMREVSDELIEYARQTKILNLECHALILQAGYANSWRFSSAERIKLLETALKIAQQHRLEQDIVVIQVLWVEIGVMEHDFKSATERGEKILPMVRSLDARLEIRCLMWVAQAHLFSGQVDQALGTYQELISLTGGNDQISLAHWNLWLGHCLLQLGQIREGTDLLRASQATFFELIPESLYFGRNSLDLLMAGLLDSGRFSELQHVLKQYLGLIDRQKFGLNDQIQDQMIVILIFLAFGQLESSYEYVVQALELNVKDSSSWNPENTDVLNSLACQIERYKRNWSKAVQHAKVAAHARFQSYGEVSEKALYLARHLEIEALLHGNEIDLARESVRRLGEFAGHYVRRQIQHLRSLAVLEAWEGNLENAINHLLEARDLMIPIGLPNERWTLEAQISGLYQQNNNLEKARETRETALKVIDSLAEKIIDLKMQKTFLEFGYKQLKSE